MAIFSTKTVGSITVSTTLWIYTKVVLDATLDSRLYLRNGGRNRNRNRSEGKT